MELDTELLDSWGWQRGRSELEPIKTDLDVAPDNVLKFIRCKYKSQHSNQCGTNVCTCFKHGIRCVEACGGRQRVACKNTVRVEIIN